PIHYVRRRRCFLARYTPTSIEDRNGLGTQRRKSVLTLAEISDANGDTREVCYPPRSLSRFLLLRNTLFAVYNPAFSLMLGLFYGVLGLYWMSAPAPGSVILTYSIFYAGFGAYSYYTNQMP